MLNYIWLSLIVIGIFVAVVGDWRDIANDKYQNGKEFNIAIKISDNTGEPLQKSRAYSCSLIYSEEREIIQRANLIMADDHSGVVHIFLDEHTPPLWRAIFAAQNKKDYLLASVRRDKADTLNFKATLSFAPVKFVKLNSVTNDGIVKYAKTAVELAIGLIGIMALWLGVMKIAEASGLITKIAGFLKPITTRLFPDVPPEHPAMGAMIMNISANILGLANAATPLGLKAMEELNKLNKKLGTATDAMCTFLVINTSNVQLIPATVIAIRAASGSSNPTEIIGAVIVATTVSTIVGITVVKLLAGLKIFRKQLEPNK
ncbi:MAG: nucleoside recognition domain-containing protein [Bacteroidota bacterium]|nr:nucleoside recognition domain-containing protein [Bacteroidota bacterium]